MNSNDKKIMVVVDDNVEFYDLIAAFFKPKGFEVIYYDCPDKAIQASSSLGKVWSVLLTDHHFGLVNEAEFDQSIKLQLPKLPIVLISSDELSSQSYDDSDDRVDDFLSSPKHFKKLKFAVDASLNIEIINEESSEVRKLVKDVVFKHELLLGQNLKFLAVVHIAERVSKSMATILLTGETGTGKEVFAKFIHNNSRFCSGPFTAINCSSIPENLLESELFGHAKGSFTGAQDKRIGLFEAAENGTLFLDEIGDLSLSLQAKLLRVLQERKIKRIGENRDIPINCRIISATHKDLSIEIKESRFREDLFFRLNVIPITIPPLRERPEDVVLIAESFLKKFAEQNDSCAESFSADAIKFIIGNRWAGNVRELENTIERAVVLSDGREITLNNFFIFPDINQQLPLLPDSTLCDENVFCVKYLINLPSLDEVINKYITYAIFKNGGARDKAAKDIGIDRKTLYRRMQSEYNRVHLN